MASALPEDTFIVAELSMVTATLLAPDALALCEWRMSPLHSKTPEPVLDSTQPAITSRPNHLVPPSRREVIP